MTDKKPERIQKVLAAAGIGSRRQLESWIKAGRISVNGDTATLGQKISVADQVRIDNKPVTLGFATQARVLAYNKPAGEICTRNDPEGRKTIFDDLPKLRGGRWISVGRLDINSSGLILLTTDGRLADALMRPAKQVIREYQVRVLGDVRDAEIAKLKKGVQLDDGPAKFETIEVKQGKGANRWYICTLREGRKREVRRLWEAVGCKVSRLIRTRYGSIRLPRNLKSGRAMELDARGLEQLYRSAGLEP
ncbi:MAG: pseudouridine synthase [Gammaproteobacteria bacterium]|nr:pseudouridine synthase [Gammaproteobacteria bacterium]